MNKADWIEAVQNSLGGAASEAAAERATDAVLAAVKRGRRRDKEAALAGFGTFVAVVRPARRGLQSARETAEGDRGDQDRAVAAGAERRAMAGGRRARHRAVSDSTGGGARTWLGSDV